MQIEKINNNKLKVILDTNDLEKNNIDLNNFMANSLESQELFLDILDLAEDEFNFYVDDSKLIIESISLSNNIFVFTITKLSNYKDNNSKNCIYQFYDFNQIHYIISILKEKCPFQIYTYNKHFYLIINKNSIYNEIIGEFCSKKFISDELINILSEHGKLLDLSSTLITH